MKKILSIFLSLMMLASCMVSFAEDIPAEEPVKALALVSSTPAHATDDSTAKYVSFTFNNDISSAEVLINGEEASCTVDGKTVIADDELKQFCDYSAEVKVTDVNGQSLSETVYFSTTGSAIEIFANNESAGGASYPYDANGLVAKPKVYLTSPVNSKTSNFVLYKIPVPDTNGSPLNSYIFKFVGSVQSGIKILKFEGEDWNTAELNFNHEKVQNIIANNGDYNASQSTTVNKLANYTFEYSCNVTDYVKECMENNQEYMYYGMCSINSTAGVYNFGSNYVPKWTCEVVNYKFEVLDVCAELDGNVLSSLSFNLLTDVEDINSVVALRETESGNIADVSFEPGSENGKYILSAPVELTEGVDYEFVLLANSEDLHGNTIDNDKILARLYAKGEEFVPEAKDDAEDIFDFKVNADTSTLTIFYKNPEYSNSAVDVRISNTESGEDARNETIISGKRGTVYLKDISLPESGSYRLMVYPQNASYCLVKDFKFVSAADTLYLWETIASGGASADISAEWDGISSLFGFESEYFEDITDMSVFFDKLEDNRDSSIADMNTENISLMRTFVKNMSFFTALEQTKDSGKFINLINSELALVKAQNEEIHDMWVECAESKYAQKTTEALIDSIESISSAEDLTKLMDKAFDVYKVEIILDLLEEADHSSEITDIILDEGNAKLLGVEELIDSYKAIESKTKINESLMTKFEDAKEFAEFFAEALKTNEETEKEKEKEKPSSPSSGKGSPGKGKGKGGSTVVVSSAPVVQAPFSPFSDVENVAWAKDHITKLYNKGVINGKSQGNFAPNDTITREEITKLLVTLGKFQPVNSADKFDDVASGSWYEQYVNIAVSNGIVNGMGNAKFGTGMNATRQDIAVMIVNMLTKLGVTVEGGNLSFGDGEQVSDYAKNPVAFLASKGILTGDTFGNFNPKSNATRAEVAVMLSRVCDIFAKEVK